MLYRILLINDQSSCEIEKVKYFIAENIFFSGNYNTELYKYASAKVDYQIIGKKQQTKSIPLPIKSPSLNSNNNFDKSEQNKSFLHNIFLIIISFCLITFHIIWYNQN